MPDEIAASLEEFGFVVVEHVLGEVELNELRQRLAPLLEAAALGDNEFDGFLTRRVFDPLAQTRCLDAVVTHPLVQDVVIRSLPWTYQFGMTILADVQPGQKAQRPHRDASVYPLPPSFPEVMTNTIWALDDFTATNGATLVAPGSHRDESAALTPVEMPAGSVVIYSGRLLHGAGANTSDRSRLGLIIEHVARWLRPGDCHPMTVGSRQAASLSTELQELLGFNQHGDYLGFIGGLPPATWLSRHSNGASE